MLMERVLLMEEQITGIAVSGLLLSEEDLRPSLAARRDDAETHDGNDGDTDSDGGDSDGGDSDGGDSDGGDSDGGDSDGDDSDGS